MSRVSKNNNASHAWQPTATLEILQQRAAILAQVRQFFAARKILEVETPLLSHATVTDPYILSIPALFKEHGESLSQSVYLQTSPEYAMKRLLVQNAVPIYQICKAFRQGDHGKLHNPEFTILEWYRPGFDHHALMQEVDELLQTILHTQPAERLSYSMAFQKFVGINPHTASLEELMACAQQHDIHFMAKASRNHWLDLLLTQCIEPNIGQTQPVFLYDFPVTQAALAKIRYTDNPPVASRFEVYFKGLELANGFHELQNATEQRTRFENNLIERAEQGIAPVPLDERFLTALEVGLPDCAGVALGIDRLIMLALNCKTLAETLSFAFVNA